MLGTSLAATAVVAAPDDGGGDRVQQYREKTQVVFVKAPTRAQRNRVIALGLDATEHATTKGIEVVLYGDRDAATLRRAGFTWDVRVADLEAQTRANARKNQRYAARVAESPLPSGRTTYRRLSDYQSELTELANKYPTLTKPITLSKRTVLGKRIRGIEITRNADTVQDGKPTFVMLGAHHAREWPSAEHSMEFAYDLLQGYRLGKARNREILSNERIIIVPIVNVDGFQISRQAPVLGEDYSAFNYEMKRKNCRISQFTPEEERGGTCEDNPAGRLRGTDLNRNYPGFWGGNGAATNWRQDTYRGDAPSSEPEVRAIRKLISDRAVTVMITNHTYSNLVLRVPSIAATGKSPDEVEYKALGDSMAEANSYTSQASYQLYDTSGSTEDWSYWNTGGFGFTFEIGPDTFHPDYQAGVVAEYLGVAPADGAGKGGNREAYYRAAEAAMTNRLHSRIKGNAPAGYTLQVRKRFISQTSDVIDAAGNEGRPRYYQDTLTTRYISDGGSFTMHVNPSTRPVVVGRYGRDPVAPPQEPADLTNPQGVPAVGGSETSTFEIQGPPAADNGTATLSFKWPNGADWDYQILDPAGEPIASAATLDNPEVATIPDPVPGTYTVEAVNYEGGSAEDDWTGEVTFQSPEPATYTGLKEAWTLTCENRRGKIISTREVIVDRGEIFRAGDACAPGIGAVAAKR
ncbi:hypothetical protein K8W59_06490 [Nocardioides rotundus]|uniref:M14 family zinc carboxypeptidase n=1 Tax=Nocardioides rotundus TaxID=1774216 RepID=UPI001CBC0ABB|nr:M14 family zinc carboxypeptidase [Nocardioides rotundus]UAL31114.1 hypothetical protein K8W59_06490 [Nocardioides rotundus]